VIRVKICGLRGEDAAYACVRAHADFVGLNFVPGRRRALRLREAKDLLHILLPEDIEPVGVFRDQEQREIETLAAELGFDWVQLHGAEPPSLCARLSQSGLHVIKAFPVGEDFDPRVLDEYAEHVDIFLLDGPRPGEGVPFRWASLAEIPRVRPIFLAGGLDPENVGRAIAEAHPDGVDTASGVEVAGRSDPDRIRAFCAAARAA